MPSFEGATTSSGQAREVDVSALLAEVEELRHRLHTTERELREARIDLTQAKAR